MNHELIFREAAGEDLRHLAIEGKSSAELAGYITASSPETKTAINTLIADFVSINPGFMMALMKDSNPRNGGTIIALTAMAILAGARLQERISKREAEAAKE